MTRLNSARPDPFHDLQFFLKAFEPFIDKTAVAIGITRTDEAPRPTVADYHMQLQNSSSRFPIFEVDARQRSDVSLLIEALLYSLDPGLVA